MSTALPTLEDVRDAAARIAGTVVRTPLVRLGVLEGPAEIYLKLENLQPIGSFKLRGATNAIACMPAARLAAGVITASAGNMAQGVAWRARALGIPCTVVAPDTAPDTKVKAIERLGGRVIKVPFAEWWQTLERRAFPGVEATFVHAFDDLDVMAGNGTLALEVIEDLPDVEAIVIPWGGGGLACGVASAARALKPACRLYTAEALTAAPFAASFEAGTPQVVEQQASWVDGIGSRTVFPQMFARARTIMDGALTASLDDIGAALRTLIERNRVVAEGAGACPVACALSGGAGRGKIVCIVSGGNIDSSKLAALLAGGAR